MIIVIITVPCVQIQGSPDRVGDPSYGNLSLQVPSANESRMEKDNLGGDRCRESRLLTPSKEGIAPRASRAAAALPNANGSRAPSPQMLCSSFPHPTEWTRIVCGSIIEEGKARSPSTDHVRLIPQARGKGRAREGRPGVVFCPCS